MFDGDVGMDDFSLVLGTLHMYGHAHVQSHSGMATGGMGDNCPPPTFAKMVLELSLKLMRK